jgi:DNA-directed RNA polymerase specialized sigma24 family protein
MSPRASRFGSPLDGLTDRHRDALLLREGAGLGAADMGRVLGMSTAEARIVLHDARLSLRSELFARMRLA